MIQLVASFNVQLTLSFARNCGISLRDEFSRRTWLLPNVEIGCLTPRQTDAGGGAEGIPASCRLYGNSCTETPCSQCGVA